MSLDSPLLAVNGGSRTRSEPWPTFSKGTNYIQPEDEEAAIKAIKSRHYHRYDSRPVAETECGAFERDLTDYFGCRYALGVANGTVAVALPLLALDLPPGSLVACPGFTFTATPSAIVLAGHRPLLVETDEDLNFDLEDLKRRWTPDIRAIVVVHMRGLACDVPSVIEFAREMGVPVVEDAVPSLGAKLNGAKLGTFGVAGAFSMQSGKMLNTGEGGFIVTDNETLYQRALVLAGGYETHLLRHVDTTLTDWRAHPVFNFRLDEIRAALGRSELSHLDERVAHQRANYQYIAEQLSSLDKIRVRQPAAPGALLGDSLIMRVFDGPERARWFAKALTAEGIDTRAMDDPGSANARCFWNWAYLAPDKSEADRRDMLPRTAALLAESVDVPLSHALRRHDCEQLVEAIEKVHKAL